MEEEELVRGAQALSVVLRVVAVILMAVLGLWIWRRYGS
jgi:hypothetical protein